MTPYDSQVAALAFAITSRPDARLEVLDHYRMLWASNPPLLAVVDRMTAKFDRYPDLKDAARALALDDSTLVCTAGKALLASLEMREQP